MGVGDFGYGSFGAGKFGGMADVSVSITGIAVVSALGAVTPTETDFVKGVMVTCSLGTVRLIARRLVYIQQTGAYPNTQTQFKMPRKPGSFKKSPASHARKTDGGEEHDIECILLLIAA